jgi:DNA-binding LytR/AlgR family response regulator
MSLKIAICDDEDSIGFQVEEYIKKICCNLNIAVEIEVFNRGENLCKSLSEDEVYDLIFLDIELPNINGVQVGTKIRNEYKDEFTQIVYISWKSEYALELFDINTLNFLVKPLDYDKLEKVINRFLKISGFWTDVFTYKYGHDIFKIKLKDIKYFQGGGKKVIIHRKDKTEDYYGSLEEVYNQLSRYDFLYIHKSYIVNYDYISVFEYEKVIMSDGAVLPIAQLKRKEIKQRQGELLKRRS